MAKFYRNSIVFISIQMLFTGVLNAQFTAYIINDKDGYTNIRKEPNVRSQIIGKVFEHEVFFGIPNDCSWGTEATENWEAITSSKNPDGYIFRKNILEIKDLPAIAGKGNFELLPESKESIITGKRDNITITMKLQPFNIQNHKESVRGGTSDAYEDNVKHNTINNEIVEIEIVSNGKRIILPKERYIDYCDISFFRLYIGKNGGLYLHFGGGGDGGSYGIWFSIVDGKILYECVSISLCI